MGIWVKAKSTFNNEQVSQDGNTVVIKVKQQPREGKANQAVINFWHSVSAFPRAKLRLSVAPEANTRLSSERESGTIRKAVTRFCSAFQPEAAWSHRLRYSFNAIVSFKARAA